MYERILQSVFPFFIILSLFNFIWTWVLTAARPPKDREENARLAQPKVLRPYPGEAGPEGVIKTVTEELSPRTHLTR